MLNVSQMQTMDTKTNTNTNSENKYKNISLICRSTTQSSHSSHPSINGKDNGNTQTTQPSPQPQAQDVSASSSQSIPSVASVLTPSQPLRSTVLANNSDIDDNVFPKGESTDQKSPMCRINEISRYNDIKQEYHLVEEVGPPHKKTFTVVLKLGETEEYKGKGPSIKKAQRCAAELALEKTRLKHPTNRVAKHCNRSVWPMTPTVELNVLAMKLGQNPVYQVYEPPPRPQAPTFSFGAATLKPSNAYDFRGMHYQRYHVPRGLYMASLEVGDHRFVGKGRTAQAARHSAAEEALKVLKGVAQTSSHTTSNCPERDDNESVGKETTNGSDLIKSPISLVHEMALRMNLTVHFEVVGESGPSHMPVFVTQCTVGQVVTKGEGNGKRASKKCTAIRMIEELSKLETIPSCDKCDENKGSEESAGAGDEEAHRERERTGRQSNGRRNAFSNRNRKQNKSISNDMNITNEAISNEVNIDCNNSVINSKLKLINNNNNNDCLTSDVSDGEPVHPINRLMQLQQARKEMEPQFILISERCVDRRQREFSIECRIHVSKGPNGPQVVSAVGLGPNKKVAKKNSAESMLQLLGYSSRPHLQSILKQDSSDSQTSKMQKKIRQVKFVEGNGCSSVADVSASSHAPQSHPKLGRQLVPGLILMPTTDVVKTANTGLGDSNPVQLCSEITSNANISSKIKSISNIAKEFLDSMTTNCKNKGLSLDSEQTETEREAEEETTETGSRLRSTVDQLKSLCNTVGCHQLNVHFSDFPKKHTNGQSLEYLSVVTITSMWNQIPIVSHGSGQTQDEARNQASHQALIALSQLDSTQYS